MCNDNPLLIITGTIVSMIGATTIVISMLMYYNIVGPDPHECVITNLKRVGDTCGQYDTGCDKANYVLVSIDGYCKNKTYSIVDNHENIEDGMIVDCWKTGDSNSCNHNWYTYGGKIGIIIFIAISWVIFICGIGCICPCAFELLGGDCD